jgi:hypothetical protein
VAEFMTTAAGRWRVIATGNPSYHPGCADAGGTTRGHAR